MAAGSSTDALIVCFTVIFLCALVVAIRLALRSSSRFRTLPLGVQYEAVRHVINMLAEVVLGCCHLRVLTHEASYGSDVLYGYSDFAHKSFLLTIGAYMVDSLLYAAHPAPTSATGGWLVHHVFTMAFLLWTVSFRRSSAFPAAAFLVSNIAHPFADLRWLLVLADIRGPVVSTLTELATAIAVCTSFVLPPPFLVMRASREAGISVARFAVTRMRLCCWAGSLLFYIPHVIIPVMQIKRLINGWGRPAKPFRIAKKEH